MSTATLKLNSHGNCASMYMKASNLFNLNKEEVLQAQQPPMLNIVKKESWQPVNQICKDWQY